MGGSFMLPYPGEQVMSRGEGLESVRKAPLPIYPAGVGQTELFEWPEAGMPAVIQTACINPVTRLQPLFEAGPTHGRQGVGKELLPPRRDLVRPDELSGGILVALD